MIISGKPREDDIPPPEDKPSFGTIEALMNKDDQLSLGYRMEAGFIRKILAQCRRSPKLWAYVLDEQAMKKAIKDSYGYTMQPNDSRLKHAFWLEYNNACADDRMMDFRNVHALISSDEVFYNTFLRKPFMAPYLITRPAFYEASLKEMLYHGMDQLRLVLDEPHVDESGKINTKLLEIKLKVVSMIDLRLHGAPTQRLHQINQNVNGPGLPSPQAKDLTQLVAKGDMKAIQEKILELEQEKMKVEGRKYKLEPVDVEIPVESK